MVRLVAACAVVIATAAAGYLALALWPVGGGTAIPANLAGDAARGAYLARISGCVACHTNTAQGGAPLAGGAPLDTPFGVFHPPNITSDPVAGIGAWSLEDFARAVRRGVSEQGRPYYPVFPYDFYTHLTDQDVADLYAALRTVAPVAQTTRPHEIDPPFNVRAALKLWRALYFEPGPLPPGVSDDLAVERGRYLVRAAVHCGACHTPRNRLGARVETRRFDGAEGLPGGGSAPPITPEALRKRGWTAADLADALNSGLTPDGDVLGGLMGEAIANSLRFMTGSDRAAVAAYLLAAAPEPAGR